MSKLYNYITIGNIIIYFIIDSIYCSRSHCPFSYGIGSVLLLFNVWGLFYYRKSISKNIKVFWPLLLLYFYFLISGFAYYKDFNSIVGIGKIIWTISPLMVSMLAYVLAVNVNIHNITKLIIISLVLSTYGAMLGYSDMSDHRTSAYFFFYSVLPFVLVYCIHYFSLYNSKLYYLLIGLSILVIILSTKRGALLAVVPILVTRVLFKNGKIRVNIKYIILFMALFVVVYYYFNDFIATITERFAEDDSTNYGSGRSYIWELVLTKYASGSLADKLLGFGNYSVYNLTGFFLDHDYSAHSTYLALLFEYGIVGLSMYLLVLYKMFKITFTAIKKEYKYSNIMLSLLLCLVMIGITEYLFEFYMWFFALYLFWHLARKSQCISK